MFCACYNGIIRLKIAKKIQIYLAIYPVISGKSKWIKIQIVLNIDPIGSGQVYGAAMIFFTV